MQQKVYFILMDDSFLLRYTLSFLLVGYWLLFDHFTQYCEMHKSHVTLIVKLCTASPVCAGT